MAQDDDSFGLPDINYKPLDPKPKTPPPPPPKEVKKPELKPTGRIQTAGSPNRVIPRVEEQEIGGSKTTVIVGIIVPILILVGGYFGYRYLYQIPKEKAAKELIVKEKLAKEKKEKEEAARLAKLKADEEARLAEIANAKPAIGTMETISSPTGRYYVVISSSIDDDLVNDYAQKLSPKGVSTKIIPPFGKWKYFRLTISDHETFALAQTSADEAKAEYGDGIWVMKY